MFWTVKVITERGQEYYGAFNRVEIPDDDQKAIQDGYEQLQRALCPQRDTALKLYKEKYKHPEQEFEITFIQPAVLEKSVVVVQTTMFVPQVQR